MLIFAPRGNYCLLGYLFERKNMCEILSPKMNPSYFPFVYPMLAAAKNRNRRVHSKINIKRIGEVAKSQSMEAEHQGWHPTLKKESKKMKIENKPIIHNVFPGKEFTKLEQQRIASQILLQLSLIQHDEHSPKPQTSGIMGA